MKPDRRPTQIAVRSFPGATYIYALATFSHFIVLYESRTLVKNYVSN